MKTLVGGSAAVWEDHSGLYLSTASGSLGALGSAACDNIAEDFTSVEVPNDKSNVLYDVY